MRTTTTAALAVGASALAIPTAAQADVQSSVQVPLAGHLTVASQMRAEHTELAQQRLTRKATRLADRVADARDRGFSPRIYRRRVGNEPPARLARRVRDLRGDLKAAHRRERAARRLKKHASASPTLEAIAACESGGRPSAVGGNGAFRGKYQFTVETWQSVGGSGDPAAASEIEQNRRAALLYERDGSAPWPVCGR
jgi:hypothetical protein